MSKVDVRVSACEVEILIRDLPHLLLRRSEITGVHAYIRTAGTREPVYFIEFLTNGDPVVADYDKRGLWEKILRELRDAKIFDNMQGSGPLRGGA